MEIRGYGVNEEQVKNGWTIWNNPEERKLVREVGEFLQMPYSQRKENLPKLIGLASKLDPATFKEVMIVATDENYQFNPNQLNYPDSKEKIWKLDSLN